MSSDHDEIISKFINVTNCQIETAVDILAGTDWDLEKAFNFYFGTDQTKKKPKKIAPKKIIPIAEPKIQNEPREEMILAGKNPKFVEIRKQAQERKRWIAVYLTDKPLKTSVLKHVRLYDMMNCRFVGLEISREEQDGRWFSFTYNVTKTPFLAVIEPTTTECIESIICPLNESEIFNFLYQFLVSHPQYGLPIDVELGQLEAEIDESDSQESNSQNPNPEENVETEDVGSPVSVMVQMPNGKRCKLEIGENSKIKLLYQKVSSLIEKKPGTFKLFLMPFTELSDQNKTVAEVGCKRSLVRVEEI
ncbi:UBX domain-containing protein 7 [Histomonas meleagridis]|uniref:UBX domain-containing protein 7 n=1 Tax=Histomonas meleagridis TaxID=135588 RepID=UPI003559AC2B|nr:UBX domain-containing protein 7 [Histomonas meleagridis]KAH0802274.1 UBX domain-containing protein 7 [Histomonas meleagridis]